MTPEGFVPPRIGGQGGKIIPNPGLAILENVTSTIRGMVEIEQAQRDRNLNNTVAIAGVGLATSQLASAVVIAQKPPEKCNQQCTPFFLTEAFILSIVTGLATSFLVWIVLTLFRRK